MRFIIDIQLISNGFIAVINKKKHPVKYPPLVWNSFPQQLRRSFAEFITFMSTVHFAFIPSNTIKYLFPSPLLRTLFYYGLFLSMPENLIDFDNNLKTTDYLRIVFNSFFRTEFTGYSEQIEGDNYTYLPEKDKAMIPFTFGKDSLLTYSLCREIGIQTIPVFLIEKNNIYENQIREKLINKFKSKTEDTVITFPVPLQELKQKRGLFWGWDIFLTQYTFYLIPFMHYYRNAYFFWSNEFDRNITEIDPQGYIVNPTFEQSSRWLQLLSSSLKIFGVSPFIGSLIDPLSELSVHYILHHRYPKISFYQTSCNNDFPGKDGSRWCCRCVPCAETYLYMVALGFDPKRVDLQENMFKKNKKKYYYLFRKKKRKFSFSLVDFDFFNNEQKLAFYLAFSRGVRGKLIDEFVKDYFSYAQNSLSKFKKIYLSPHRLNGNFSNLSVMINRIFQEELRPLRNRISG